MADAGTADGPVLDVRIWRGAEKGTFVRYEVPARANQTVLDVVTWVQRHREPDLAYRFACRVGVCGSCAMTVNGRPRWTCRTHVKRLPADRPLVLEPLRNLPRIRDLVCDLEPFFARWERAGGRFVATATRRDPLPRIAPDSAARRAVDAGIECINCAVCHAACDVLAWRPEYLGPAPLNRAWTLFNDIRHGAREEVLDRTSGDAGCHACHSQASCSEFCPVGLAPTAAIAGLKRASLWRLLGRARA